MNGLLDKYKQSDSKRARIGRLVKYISDSLHTNSNTREILVHDPFLDFGSEVKGPLDEGQVDSVFFASFLVHLSDVIKTGEIRLLTQKELPNERRGTVPLRFPYSSSHCGDLEINVKVYSRNRRGSNLPKRMHDRWILNVSDDDQCLEGVHVGPSLGDIDGKDVTITLMGNGLAREVMARYNSMWEGAR